MVCVYSVCADFGVVLLLLCQGVHCTVVSCDSYYKGLGPDEEPENHNFDDPAALEFSLLARQLDDLKVCVSV